MVLIIYLVIFTVAFWFRHRQLTGGNLKFHMNPDGKTFFETLEYTNKKKKVSPSLGLPLETPLSFIVSPEKWYHRFLKSIGLAQELQTGDMELDWRLFFACDRPDSLLLLIEKKPFQQAIKALFVSMEVRELRLYNGKIWIQGKAVDAAAYTPQHASQHLRLLNAIAAQFDAAALPTPVYESLLTPMRAAILLMTGHAAFFTLGTFGGLPLFFETTDIIDLHRFLVTSGIAAAAFSFFWVYLIILLIGRGSWLPMVVSDFALMGLAGIFLSTAFTVSEANIYFDHAPVTSFVQPVTQKHCELKCTSKSGKHTRSSHYTLSEMQCRPRMRAAALEEYKRRDYKCARRSSFSYKLVVPPWTAEQDKNYTFSVKDTVYDRTAVGDNFRIPMHPGAFGITWVDTQEITPAAQE